MIRPEARLVDRQRAAIKRLGLAEAVRVSEQFREIVEADRHLGMIRPELASSIASARRNSGSASAKRAFAMKQHAELIE